MKINKENLLGFMNSAEQLEPMVGGKGTLIDIRIEEVSNDTDSEFDEVANIADNTSQDQSDSDNTEIA